jgi:hypothetical protein
MKNADRIHHENEGSMLLHSVNTQLQQTARRHDLQYRNINSNFPNPITPVQTSQLRNYTSKY